MNIKNYDLDSEEVKEFLKKDPKSLNRDETKLFFALRAEIRNKRILLYKTKNNVLHRLGYNIQFVGFKNPQTKQVMSFYSNIYAEQHGKEVKFKNQDAYFNKMNYIQKHFDNYGFIQQDISNVLWLDLDCHEEYLQEDYIKIRQFILNEYENSSLVENKNNGMGTHVWLFIKSKISSADRRLIQKYLQIMCSNILKIDIEKCKQIIDMPKAWFRVPGTIDYRVNGYTEYDVYHMFDNNIFDKEHNAWDVDINRIKTFITDMQHKNQSIKKAYQKTEKTVKVQENDMFKNLSNSEIGKKLLKEGLKKGSSYEQLSQLVPFILHQTKKQYPDLQENIDKIVDVILKIGGNAEILCNKKQLKLQVASLVKGLNIHSNGKSEVYLPSSKNWREYISDISVRIAEDCAIHMFVDDFNKKAKKHKLSYDSIKKIIDNFIVEYLKVQDSTQYSQLCGNLGSRYIADIIEIQGEPTAIIRKITAFISNLYGLYLVINEDGEYYVPNTFCSRYVVLNDMYECVLHEGIFPIIAKNILNFQKIIKSTRIKDLVVRKTIIKSFKEPITQYEIADKNITIKYEERRKKVIQTRFPHLKQNT